MMSKQIGGETFRDTFFTEHFQRLLLQFVQCIYLEPFLVSLDKSVLLHRRCLISKFSEMLILLFIRFYIKVFPIAMVSLFCKNLILSILTYTMIGNIFVQLINFCSIQFLFHARVFPVNFAKLRRTPFLTEHL